MSPKDAPRDHFGIHSNTGVSDIVFARPFRLLSRDACNRTGEDIVSEVMKKCLFKSGREKFVRGMVLR